MEQLIAMKGRGLKAFGNFASCIRPASLPHLRESADCSKDFDFLDPFSNFKLCPKAMVLGTLKVTPDPFRVIEGSYRRAVIEGLTFPIPCDRKLQFRESLSILANHS
jgi:hypothetical protein